MSRQQTSLRIALACIGLAALVVACGVAFGQTNEVTYSWQPSPGATGYRLHVGTESRVYGAVTDAAPGTQLTYAHASPSTIYYACVSALNAAGESECSNELESWPRPEVVATPTDCIPGPTGVSCTTYVAGFNFAPGVTAAMNYTGVTVTNVTRDSDRALRVEFTIAPTATGGTTALEVGNPWRVSDPPDAASGTLFTVSSITITPVVIPDPPSGLVVR